MPRRVLVTRPAGQGQALCDAVVAAGHRAFSQPLLELQALPELPAAQRALILDLDLYQQVIFISGNAVRFGMALINDYWPQLPSGVNWFAIGGSTAALLADEGVTVLSPTGDMTSESLLALPQLQSVVGDRVLIVKGEGGRDTLRRELTSRQARVDELACYQRRRPALAQGELAGRLTDWQIDTILLSSGEGLANLLGLLSPAESTNLKSIDVLVPSGRVAKQAQEVGFARVITAENASDAAMLRALDQSYPAVENMSE
jgi:uroporphyrinogen-III synthase